MKRTKPTFATLYSALYTHNNHSLCVTLVYFSLFLVLLFCIIIQHLEYSLYVFQYALPDEWLALGAQQVVLTVLGQ